MLWLRLLQWLCVIIAANISSSEANNYIGTAASILAVTAITASYATSKNPSGSALGLRLYFPVYPSSCHNTDSVTSVCSVCVQPAVSRVQSGASRADRALGVFKTSHMSSFSFLLGLLETAIQLFQVYTMSSCLYDEFYVYVMMQSLYHESMSTQLVQFSSMIQVYDMRTSLYQESKSIP